MRLHILRSAFLGMAAAILAGTGLTACMDDAHDPLEDIYTAPSDVNITSATVADKVKDENLRTYTVKFGTDAGVDISMELVTNQYYLLGTKYTAIVGGVVKSGNFGTDSYVAGSRVVDGSFDLSKAGDTYTVNQCVLFTEDGKAYRINSGSVEMAFEPDDPTALPILKSATANGDGTVTVLLSTGGYTATFDMTTYTTTYTGEGNDLQIVFVSADGKLHPGTYAPGAGYVAGYEYEMTWGTYSWMVQGGTLWYTVADGAQTISMVTAGNIEVTLDGSTYTITINQGKEGIFAQYTGEINDLLP